MIFSLLYYSGMCINETTQIKCSHIDVIIQTGRTIIITHKIKVEQKLFFVYLWLKQSSIYNHVIKEYLPHQKRQARGIKKSIHVDTEKECYLTVHKR